MSAQVDVPMLSIDAVADLDEAGFLAAFGHVYEASPALAVAAWQRRPFARVEDLVSAFHLVVDELDDDEVLALLRAHPQLGATTAMTTTSTAEQRGAGLARVRDAAAVALADGNARYLERFGFPFIVAVRGLGPADVAAALAARLLHDPAEERAEAFAQVKRIAALRVAQVVAP